MRFNRTRHYFLKILSKKYNSNKNTPSENADVIGLTYAQIDSFLKNKKNYRDLILSELLKSNEIVFFDLDEKSYFIELDNGLSALTKKKYLKRNNEIIVNWFKNFVQIFIPIASLTIGILALSIKFNKIEDSNKKELQKIQQKLIILEKQINKKTTYIKNSEFDYQVDSLE